MTTVLLVSDQALQRLGCSRLLLTRPDVLVLDEAAASGSEAVRISAELHTDVA